MPFSKLGKRVGLQTQSTLVLLLETRLLKKACKGFKSCQSLKYGNPNANNARIETHELKSAKSGT